MWNASRRPQVIALATIMLLVSAVTQQTSSAASNAIIPDHLITSRIWMGSSHNSSLLWPELSSDGSDGHAIPALQAKPNVGVACSGGGHRAALLCQGTMRALRKLGLLQKTRYLSSNSGGSWFSSAFSYQNKSSVDHFLGSYLTPDRLTLATLQNTGNTPGTFSWAIVHTKRLNTWASNILQAPSLLPQVGAWSTAVSTTITSPFGLTSLKSIVAVAGTLGNISSRVAAHAVEIGADVYTAMRDPGMPFPIFVFSSIQADSKTVFFPMEFTPLYIGAPTVINSSLANITLGGYIIEPMGWNGGLAQNITFGPPGSNVIVNITSTYVSPLAEAAGTSGGYPSEILHPAGPSAVGIQKALGLPVFDYWTPQQPVKKASIWGDGGGHDNMALYPLLRRKVPKIVVALATTYPVSGTMANWSAVEDMVARAFGRFPIEHFNAPDGIDSGVINTAFKVFNESGFDTFWNAVSRRLAAGKPVFYRATYEVLANPVMGVPGNWSVDILWVLNQQVKSWEAQLPKATLKFINAQRKVGQGQQFTADSLDATDFQTFPLDGGIHGGLLQYTGRGAAALSQLRTWVMMQAKDELLDMYS